jgi:hypothetical protein
MKLNSLLDVIDDCESGLVWDDNAPIDIPPLFNGMVKDCKNRSDIKNGIVKLIIPVKRDRIDVFIDIEYQKRHKEKRADHD